MRKNEIMKWTLKVSIVAVFVLFIIYFKNITDYIGNIISLMMPFTIGLVIAYIVNMPYKVFSEKAYARLAESKNTFVKKLHQPLSIFSAYIVIAAMVAFLLGIVIPELSNSITKLSNNVDSYVIKTEFWIKSLLTNFGYTNLEKSSLFEIFNNLSTYVTGENINQLLKTGFSKISPHLFDFTKNITTTIYNILIGIVVSIYMLAYKSTLINQIKKIICAICNFRVSRFLFKVGYVMNNKVGNFIYSKIVDSIIIGIISCIMMSILKFDYAILISFIIAVFNVVPFFGPIVGAIPGFLILFIVDPIQSIWFLLYVLILQQFDGNFLGPAILGDSLGINAFWIIFSIIVGTGVLGATGMFLSVPIFAAIYTIASDYTEKRLKEKKCEIGDDKVIYGDEIIEKKNKEVVTRKVFNFSKKQKKQNNSENKGN